MLIKFIIISVVLSGAAFIVFKVWHMDIDTQKLNPKNVAKNFVDDKLSMIPQRAKNSIYQNGNIVSVAVGFKHDKLNNSCSFSEMSKSGSLDLGSPFEFREFKLKFKQADTMIGLDSSRPEDGRLIFKVVCSIIGKR